MKKELVKGIIYPNIIGLICMLLTQALKYNDFLGPIFISSDFILLPIVMGMISAYQWQNLKLSSRNRFKYSFYTTIIALFLSAFFMGEGYICLIIVSPLIYVFTITGVFIGKYIYEKRNNNLNVSFGFLILILFAIDSLSPHVYKNLVSDVMIIDAPPAEVWKHVVAYDTIREEPTFWMFKIGMPKPIATVVDGYYPGAGRKCIFNDGIVFDEKMTTFEEEQNLTFDIIEQPKDPELMGHIDIDRGQFILINNGNNTTTLIGNSWYSLYIFPSWYFDIWAKSVTRNVHLRVMEHVKHLSEKK